MFGCFNSIVVFLGAVFVFSPCAPSEVKPSDGELRLLWRLMKNHVQERQILPAENRTKVVVVTFDMAFSQLVDLDSKHQTMTSNIWVRQFWKNERLAWDPADYDGIETINVDPKIVWKPDIHLYNNIDGGGGEMYNFRTMVILHHDGRHQWFAPTEIKSICKIDITFFPFDEQVCLLTFGSWTYTSQFLDLALKTNTADLKKYTPNGQWTLISVNATKNIVKYSCCNYPYVDVTFTVNIRRRPLFYVLNLILPCILLAILTVLSFSLPPGSGERIALVITLLLGLTVYMLIFTENIPKTSEVLPLISKFFLVILFEVSFCLMGTSLTLRFYHFSEPETRIPSWVEIFIFNFLAKILQMKPITSLHRDDNSVNSKMQIKASYCSKYKGWKSCVGNASPNSSSVMGRGTLRDFVEERLDEISEKMNDIHEQVIEKKDVGRQRERWHFAASVIDRFFLYSSGLVICLSLIIFYLMIPQYDGGENKDFSE